MINNFYNKITFSKLVIYCPYTSSVYYTISLFSNSMRNFDYLYRNLYLTKKIEIDIMKVFDWAIQTRSHLTIFILIH